MNDNICAISTGIDYSPIAIIRVSGKDAFLIVDKIFSKKIKDAKSHTIHYGYIKDGKEIIDEVLVTTLKAPRTYTKEDMVEINSHGGSIVSQKILSLLLDLGCRQAEPGEFTKRAFLNGRIDLTKAEAVNDLIYAKSLAAHKMAINTVYGKLYEKINLLRCDMAKVITNIEVNIDYPEYQDELEVTHKLIKKHLNYVYESLEKILEDSNEGKIIKNGLDVAIIGRVNVGKSSLLNALIDEEKAIVTNIEGTTRDVVEGSIFLNNVLVNFVDTAGIRKTTDVVEKIGVKKSLDVLNSADLIILVLNNNEKLTNEDKELIEKVKEKKVIYFINKDDLENKNDFDGENKVYGNTLSKDGIRELKEKIKEMFKLEDVLNKDLTYLNNERQRALIKNALEEIKEAIKSEEEGMFVDLIQINVKNAWEFLGRVTGEFYEDELVDNIFENFCLGK